MLQVILADARNSTRRDIPKGVHVGAFVMPNAPIDDRIPLSAFAVPLTPLEEVAGVPCCSDKGTHNLLLVPERLDGCNTSCSCLH
eukprot:353839-Chlamydomonas_euryale.AAC.40